MRRSSKPPMHAAWPWSLPGSAISSTDGEIDWRNVCLELHELSLFLFPCNSYHYGGRSVAAWKGFFRVLPGSARFQRALVSNTRHAGCVRPQGRNLRALRASAVIFFGLRLRRDL